MIKQWELFEKVSAGRVARNMRVSLNERGSISLNQKAFDELKEPVEAELYFDKINKLIGIKPVLEHTAYSYPVRKQGENRSYIIRAMSFLTYYNIKITGTVLFISPTVEDGMLVLDMNNTKAVTKNRPQADSEQPAFVLGSAG